MESFQWNRCFVTGLDKVDEQHHYLVDLINRFGELLTQPGEPDPSAVEGVFRELERYAQYHFAEEEALMAEQDLDVRHVTKHKTEHAQFLLDVLHMHAEIAKRKEGASKSLLSFLSNWLTFHILGTDQLMAALIKARQAGESADSAFAAFHEREDPATATLLRAVSRLFDQVSERNRALHELNRTLESRVAERTRELSELNERLEEYAFSDMLTGLSNRRHAMRVLEREWQSARTDGVPFCCIMIDADGFKNVNDTFGHDAGDEVLRRLAQCLRQSVRNDDSVCRLGGDEFLVICANTPMAGALRTAEKIRSDVALISVPTGSGHWPGSVSIGVAAYEDAFTGTRDLLRVADKGVYAAKSKGRNCVACIQCTPSAVEG
ncbi:MAG TPA: bacteriohemerythrin [Usitatibacteraceae bacterium]|nr:bacteriohemerythrin [Usitatibacteraceae bacterium]